jgi:hypothetical protein
VSDWHSGAYVVELVRTGPNAPDQRVRPRGAPALARFLADLEPAELHLVVSAVNRSAQVALEANPARFGWLLDPAPGGDRDRFELWGQGSKGVVSGDGRLLALALELYVRNVLIPHDGPVEGTPPWVAPLRDDHVALLTRLYGSGLPPLAPILG